MDPDDWVEKNFLLKLYQKAEETGADITICDYVEEYPEKQVIVSHTHIHGKSIDGIKIALAKGDIWGICWNKLIKREIIDRSLPFEPGINFQEDKLYIYRLLDKVTKISFVSEVLYHYNRSNPNSAVATISVPRVLQTWEVRNKIVRHERNPQILEKVKEGLVPIYAPYDLIALKGGPSALKSQQIMKPFKRAIRKKAFTEKGIAPITRFFALASTTFLSAWLLKRFFSK